MDECGSADILVFDGFRFDRRHGGCLFRLDEAGMAEPVALRGRGLALLGFLLGRRGELISKDDIMQAVWPGRVVEEGNLYVQIAELRHLLGHGCIQTVTGHGYRFVASVTPEPGALIPVSPGNGAPSRPHVLVIVLPLTGLSEDRAQPYFADSIARELMTDLSRIADMLVSSQGAAAANREPVEIKQVPHLEWAGHAADEFVQVRPASAAAGWPGITVLKATG